MTGHHLGTLARRLAAASSGEVAVRAGRLAERVEARRFHIGVLGEFKRGKSTLVNALVGRPVLPTGVVPVTAVATEVHLGATEEGDGDAALVELADGRSQRVALAALADYVSEARNPRNARAVARVRVQVAETLGAAGVVLVDTPGLGSVHEHQTEAARDAFGDVDAAIVVLSADSPLSEAERGLVADVAARGVPLFVAVNRCDHLDDAEVEAVASYVRDALDPVVGAGVDVFTVSARRALEARDRGFERFRGSLAAFVRDGLAAALGTSAAAELRHLAARSATELAMERAAEQLGADRLEHQLSVFETAARAIRREAAEDRIVLEHEARALAERVGDALRTGAAAAADEEWPAVLAAVEGLRGRKRDRALADAVAEATRRGVEPVRASAERTLEDGWAALGARHTERTQARADRLRATAGELFDLRLPSVPVPTVAEQRHRFSYLFLEVESPGTSVVHGLAALTAVGKARAAATRRARQRLVAELDKHAGRARSDLAQRLDRAARDFLVAMDTELDDVVRAVVETAGRVRALHDTGVAARAARERARRHLESVLADVADLPAAPAPTVHAAGGGDLRPFGR